MRTGDSDLVLQAGQLLRVYDEQLREESEMVGASAWLRHGPLLWATLPGGRGFVTYRALPDDEESVAALVAATSHHFGGRPEVGEVEWKTRGHDRAAGLTGALARHGFVAEEAETVMMGEAELLAADVPLPPGVTVRTVTTEADVRRTARLQGEVFGFRPGADDTRRVLARLSDPDDGLELWVAEADGEVVSAGRLDPVPGTEVAGIWGGCTRPDWRGRGLYRALTAGRARSALRRGHPILHSDSTEGSRPILARSGLVAVTTTTPYVWRRG